MIWSFTPFCQVTFQRFEVQKYENKSSFEGGRETEFELLVWENPAIIFLER